MKKTDITNQGNASEGYAIYIVGVGRSGTSLVQSMFASHSELAFAPETSFLRRFVASSELARALRSGDSAAVQLLKADEKVSRCGLDMTAVMEDARQNGTRTPSGIYCSFLQLQARHAGKAGYGDKDPRAVEFVGVIAAVLPGVHIVHVIRDPRDVLASKKKAAWSSRGGTVKHVFANRVQIKLGRTRGRQLADGRYHELVYEALLAQPEHSLRQLCADMQLGYEGTMLDFGQSAARLVSGDEMQWKKETLGPLLANNEGKWKQQLAGWEVALTELVCKEHFEVGGYERNDRIRGLSLLQRLSVYATAVLIVVADPIYRSFRHWTVRRAQRWL